MAPQFLPKIFQTDIIGDFTPPKTARNRQNKVLNFLREKSGPSKHLP